MNLHKVLPTLWCKNAHCDYHYSRVLDCPIVVTMILAILRVQFCGDTTCQFKDLIARPYLGCIPSSIGETPTSCIRIGAFLVSIQIQFFLEKSSLLPGFEPTTSVVPSGCATNWAIQAWIPTQILSNDFHFNFSELLQRETRQVYNLFQNMLNGKWNFLKDIKKGLA